MNPTKLCSKCKKTIPVENFSKDRSRGDGLQSWCKSCCGLAIQAYCRTDHGRLTRREAWKIYHSKPEAKERARIASSVYRKKHRRKHNCGMKVQYALKTGKLLKPENCSNCGWVGKLNAHHPDYNEPLRVVWLCPSCHKRLHLKVS